MLLLLSVVFGTKVMVDGCLVVVVRLLLLEPTTPFAKDFVVVDGWMDDERKRSQSNHGFHYFSHEFIRSVRRRSLATTKSSTVD